MATSEGGQGTGLPDSKEQLSLETEGPQGLVLCQALCPGLEPCEAGATLQPLSKETKAQDEQLT